jgi:acetoacetyl-CoA reductase
MSRIALVTGGTRGIGGAISRRLKDQGYVVAATYLGNDTKAASFRAETDIATFKWDVSEFSDCDAGVKQVIQALGGPVAVLVNNAGITRDVPLHKMTTVQWHEVIATNLDSCFNMCRAVIGSMRDQGFGRIINIASVNGQKGQFGQTNYAAAKAGIMGFTKALALENASKGVTVNAVAPGYTATDMVAAVPPAILEKIIARIPVGRLAQPQEVAAIVAYLAGEEAAFVTGATFAINGGQYMA